MVHPHPSHLLLLLVARSSSVQYDPAAREPAVLRKSERVFYATRITLPRLEGRSLLQRAGGLARGLATFVQCWNTL